MKKEFNEVVEEFEFDGIKCSLGTGKYAQRATSSVVGKMGDTVVLATVCHSDPMEGADYFPLQVEYIERMYAGGVISSSRFIKREGHPSTGATLAARMIDRSVRSRFPDGYRDTVQIILTVLSYDPENDPVLIGFAAVSAALMISDTPFIGPIAGVRVGMVDDELCMYTKNVDDSTNYDETKLNLVMGTDGDVVTMIDSDSNELDEGQFIEAMKLGVEKSKELIDAQNRFMKKVENSHGTIYKTEYESYSVPKDLISSVKKDKNKEIEKALLIAERKEKDDAMDAIRDQLFEEYEGKFTKSVISEAFSYAAKEIVRGWLLDDKKRIDGRKLDEIRPLDMEVGVLPRAHGSALFTRGDTQGLTVTTLGSGRLAQLIEGMEGEDKKRYMHHYNAPDFTVGEAGRYRFYPGRREVGHGALAEKALIPVIPDEETFPYTIRVVSDIMAQSGSSSMAATCGSTLSLMDAGVPISKPVSGIAMGVVTDDDFKNYVILTDIAEFEDHFGDMDFKVTGTRDGITAVQMDNKKNGLPMEIFEKAIEQSKEARMFLIDEMEKIISKPRVSLSKYAPKIEVINIPVKKIGDVIGPGGKIIKQIIEETGAEIEIKDDGTVCIASSDEEQRQKAVEMVEGLVMEPEVGKVYEGKITRIEDFGAFVQVNPSISGLVHISEMAEGFVKDPRKIVKEGQEVKAKIIGIDEKGRVKMSMKGVKQEAGSDEEKNAKKKVEDKKKAAEE
ncbi:polyribonucleotide nucleotidyltransferase [Candidatus Dojkabacteria bacterium]|nr:polyribonucleotide nucleotidyltransferase [Candidatus Dojkabacteria bacterium]